MSKLITVARLDSGGGDWSETCRAIDMVARDLEIGQSHHYFTALPGPRRDPAILKSHVRMTSDYQDDDTIGIRAGVERCGAVSVEQFLVWWPEWVMNALTHEHAKHDVELVLFKVPKEGVRIGKYQSVFNPLIADAPIVIPLAGSLHDGMDLLRFHLPEKFNDWHLFDRVPAARGDDDAISF